jgi:putative inorganic carbon (hco3(-)) transporter
VVATLVSIAGCEILLGAAFLATLYAWRRLDFPPIRLPLGLFVAGTLLSLAFSTNPAAGFPQVKKLYLFLVLAVVVTAVHSWRSVRNMYLWCAAAGAGSAAWSLVQFWRKYHAAHELHQPFYTYYMGARITGFMSHWMTFGGQMSIALLLLIAVLIFAPPPPRWRAAAYAAIAVMAAGLVLAFTRGMWFAAIAGFLYLLAIWRPKLLFAVPVIAVVGFFAAPRAVQERVQSVYQPHGQVDSNQHRIVTWRTGVEMVKSHPLLGLGPEHVGREFQQYVPADIPRPLPVGWYGHLHNIYLQYAAERGIPVLLCMLWLIVKALRDAAIALRSTTPERKAVLHGAIAVIIAVLVGGFFEFNLGDSEVLMLFLGILACIYVREPEVA